jgi:hypothetical protein
MNQVDLGLTGLTRLIRSLAVMMVIKNLGRHTNPTFEQMARHWFYSFGTNPVLSRLFAHMLVSEFQVGDLKNIWLIDSGCSRHMTGDRGGSQVSSRW